MHVKSVTCCTPSPAPLMKHSWKEKLRTFTEIFILPILWGELKKRKREINSISGNSWQHGHSAIVIAWSTSIPLDFQRYYAFQRNTSHAFLNWIIIWRQIPQRNIFWRLRRQLRGLELIIWIWDYRVHFPVLPNFPRTTGYVPQTNK